MGDYYPYSPPPPSSGGSGGTIALAMVIFLLLAALIAIIVDTYFYPFITSQMYGGECERKGDCREGLDCRPDDKDPNTKVCKEATTTCATCNNASAESCKTFCSSQELTTAGCSTKLGSFKTLTNLDIGTYTIEELLNIADNDACMKKCQEKNSCAAYVYNTKAGNKKCWLITPNSTNERTSGVKRF
jgi:hypothetical protein